MGRICTVSSVFFVVVGGAKRSLLSVVVGLLWMLPLSQEVHIHRSLSLNFGFISLILVRYSEKKRSPLSFGKLSRFLNGKFCCVIPASNAIVLICCNSVWLKKLTTPSNAAGIFARRTLLVFSSVKDILCRIVMLCLAVPVRFKLSASVVLIPQFPKCASIR